MVTGALPRAAPTAAVPMICAAVAAGGVGVSEVDPLVVPPLPPPQPAASTATPAHSASHK
jgi:hypothetical protein